MEEFLSMLWFWWMICESEKFVKEHQGKIGNISIYGQESTQTTWKLCKMNLAIKGDRRKVEWGDSFHNNKHRDLKADYILASPPSNDKDYKGEMVPEYLLWKYGVFLL